MNRVAQIIAPKTVATLIKAARAYPKWKAENSPGLKPWIFPDQNKLSPLNVLDVRTSPDIEITSVDEEEQQQVSEEAPSPSNLSDTVCTTDVGNVEVEGDGVESDMESKEMEEKPVIDEEAIVPESAARSISIA